MNLKSIIPVAIKSVDSISVLKYLYKIKGKDKVCVHREPAEGQTLLNHDW